MRQSVTSASALLKTEANQVDGFHIRTNPDTTSTPHLIYGVFV
jgi:hypothetical protein